MDPYFDIHYNFFDENEKPLDRHATDGGYARIFRSIGCVGDSLSSGEFERFNAKGEKEYHDLFEYSWGQYIARMCGCEVRNFSRGGMTTVEYCESFAQHNGFWSSEKACQAYIIALGANDYTRIGRGEFTEGSLDDVDVNDWHNNKPTFVGYYATIIQRLKAIQPAARFFLMTFPRKASNKNGESHRALMYGLAKMFSNCYVIDLWQYGPDYDTDEFRTAMHLLGHLNPMGYIFTAEEAVSYIDYIVRHNPDDFRKVGLMTIEDTL